MCHRHSFILTRAGKVHDGLGLTDSHTTIRELAGLETNDSTTYAFEWQPPAGWPDADFNAGLTQDTAPIPYWDLKAKHLSAIEHHLRRSYPDMETWNRPDKISEAVWTMTSIKGDLVIPEGATFTAPVLAKSGYVDVREGATFTAPVLAEVSGSVVVREGATFTAPVLAKSGSVVVREGATFTAPVLAEVSGYVDVREGATFTAPVLAKSGSVDVREGATFTAPVLEKRKK